MTAAATQDHVAILVASSLENRRVAFFRHRQEMMWMRGRADRIDRNLDGAAGAILEVDG